jgi:hypothetical protein
MKLLRVLFAVAAIAACTALTAQAGTLTPRVERRESRQHARIQQGIASGQLTRREAVRLHAGQRHVDRLERRAAFDGVVTPRERFRMERAQDRQSHRIARLKHNRRAI